MSGRHIPTAEQTLGPFFPPSYIDEGANDLTLLDGRRARGVAIDLAGRILQADGQPVVNAVIELWQADAGGIYPHPADPRCAQADPDFLGHGRAATDREGRYAFRTVRPGRVPQPDGRLRAPHIEVALIASGLMRTLRTTLFFEDGAGNDTDPVLCAVPPARRALLVARREGDAGYRFDIRLAGDGETPFFED